MTIEAFWDCLARRFFDQAVPGATAVAAAGPFSVNCPAFLTNVSCLSPHHRLSSGLDLRSRQRSCSAHFHLDRTFGTAVDELVDKRVARAVDICRRSVPDDPPL